MYRRMLSTARHNEFLLVQLLLGDIVEEAGQKAFAEVVGIAARFMFGRVQANFFANVFELFPNVEGIVEISRVEKVVVTPLWSREETKEKKKRKYQCFLCLIKPIYVCAWMFGV